MDAPGGLAAGGPPELDAARDYRPAPTTEVSVSRAGGATDANIQRWIGQLTDAGSEQRVQKTIAGFHVEEVFVVGTFSGGGMMPGAAAGSHTGGSFLGAVVETSGSHDFFKMVGPVAEVQAARPAFDALLGSITPGA